MAAKGRKNLAVRMKSEMAEIQRADPAIKNLYRNTTVANAILMHVLIEKNIVTYAELDELQKSYERFYDFLTQYGTNLEEILSDD